LREIIGDFDFLTFKDRAWEDRLPALSRTVSILKDKGIYEGDAFLEWMADLLEAKGVRTFGDLLKDPGAEPVYRHGLQVVASDLTEQRLLVLPRDAHQLGIEDPDELSVALAVCMSMSIPIFFEPVCFTNTRTGREHVIVDGGMLSNFPVWLFDSKKARWPTFGLKFIEDNPRTPLGVLGSGGGLFSLVDFAWNLATTMLQAHDRLYLEQSDFDRTIAIDTLGVGITEFDLSNERAMALYNSGREAAETFLKQAWSVPLTR
jgi:NTE family protein